MNFLKINRYIQISLCCVALLFSCDGDEFEQATITFYPALAGEANEPNEGAEGAPSTIQLITSRVLSSESRVNIRINGNGAGYGYSYATNPPQLEPGVITLVIPRGENSASFTFTPKYDGVVLQNDYQYTFSIEGADKAIRSVGQKEFNMTVKEGRLRSYDFNACSSGIPQGFNERIVPGAGIITASTWTCTSFGYPNDTPNAVEANAFGKGAGESNSYLVMAAIDASLYSKFYIDFVVYSRFSGPGTIKLKYSTNYSGTGDPEAEGVVWTDMTDMNDQLPTAGSRVWTPVTGTLEGVSSSSLYFAVQFAGGTNGSSANWRIDNFEIKAE